jgi:uncharacterized membrane protein YvbJ
MFCINCGKKLNDGANFCSGCGSKVIGTDISPEDETESELEDESDINDETESEETDFSVSGIIGSLTGSFAEGFFNEIFKDNDDTTEEDDSTNI